MKSVLNIHWKAGAEAETPILWPPDANNWLTGKDPDVGKDWRQEEKRMTEDEMLGWHHRLDGHEYEQLLGVGDRQGRLECCSPWCLKETWLSNWTTPRYIDTDIGKGGFAGGASVKEPVCQCRRQKRHRFDPWVRKIPWRKKWQATPVFLPGEAHGQRGLGHSP